MLNDESCITLLRYWSQSQTINVGLPVIMVTSFFFLPFRNQHSISNSANFIFFLLSALMYASIFGNLTVIIQRLYLQNSKQHEDLRLIREFVQFYKIPRELKENLENHILNQSVFTKGCDLQAVSDSKDFARFLTSSPFAVSSEDA